MGEPVAKSPFDGLWQNYQIHNHISDTWEDFPVVVASYERNTSGFPGIRTCQKTQELILSLFVCTDYSDVEDVVRLGKAIREGRILFLNESIFRDGLSITRFFTLCFSDNNIKEFADVTFSMLFFNLKNKVVKIELTPQFTIRKIAQDSFEMVLNRNFEWLAKAFMPPPYKPESEKKVEEKKVLGKGKTTSTICTVS